MLVPELLLHTLEELLDDDFKTFQWYLSNDVLDGCKPVAKSRLEKASRIKTVSEMTGSYGEESAVNISTAILQSKLPTTTSFSPVSLSILYICIFSSSERKTAAPSTSSSASTPAAAPASISAQQGSVIIAPSVIGGTSFRKI